MIPKQTGVRRRVREHLDGGRIFYAEHAQERMSERGFDDHDVQRILRGGTAATERDFLESSTNVWRLHFEGATIDGVKGRVAFELHDDGIVIVTVVDL